MPIGTLLYKSAPKGNVYGKNIDVIFKMDKLFPPDFELNSGHTGIYVGNIHGVDMVVEAVPGGVTMDPLKYFVNLENGEKFLGAKIPKNTSKSQRKAAAAIARALAELHLKYDYSFRHQKGPNSGQWTCVGLTEKAYESADAGILDNPDMNLSGDPSLVSRLLVYNPSQYSVNITQDGYDDKSVYNK